MSETRSRTSSVCGTDWQLKPRCRRLWLSRFLGGAAFGPDEIAIMAGAYEAGLKQINVSGQNDVAAKLLAQTIVRLAKHGERDPIRLGQRAVEIMSGKPPDSRESCD